MPATAAREPLCRNLQAAPALATHARSLHWNLESADRIASCGDGVQSAAAAALQSSKYATREMGFVGQPPSSLAALARGKAYYIDPYTPFTPRPAVSSPPPPLPPLVLSGHAASLTPY